MALEEYERVTLSTLFKLNDGQGIDSAEDIDRASKLGPGIRWTVQGPFLTYHPDEPRQECIDREARKPCVCAPKDPHTNRDLSDTQRAWRNPMATDELELSKLARERSRWRASGVVLPLFLD